MFSEMNRITPFLNSFHPSRGSFPSSGSNPKTSLTLINACDKSRLIRFPLSVDLPLIVSPVFSPPYASNPMWGPSAPLLLGNGEWDLTLSRIASEMAERLNLFLLFRPRVPSSEFTGLLELLDVEGRLGIPFDGLRSDGLTASDVRALVVVCGGVDRLDDEFRSDPSARLKSPSTRLTRFRDA